MLKLTRETLYLSDFFQRRFLIEYRKWRQPNFVEIGGIKLPIGEHLSQRILKAIYGGYYEKSELQIIKDRLNQNDIVLELGTGIGLVSSYCAKKIGSNRVFTYEANPALEPHIRNTYSLNNVAPQLDICLLGEQAGEQTFYVEPGFWASSTIQRTSNAKAIQVTVKAFNTEVRRINPSFLIIDIEGGEYDLFKFADLHNVQKILIELHENVIGKKKVELVKQKLAQTGFKINKNLSIRDELFLQR
jgi:FkbM family methyltransferase